MSNNSNNYEDEWIQVDLRAAKQKNDYGNLLHSHLQKLGTIFSNSPTGNCEIDKAEATRRFHLVEGSVGYLIFIWHGTGLYVECKDNELPEQDDLWRYSEDSNYKLTTVHVFFSGSSTNLVGISIRDELGLFHSQYKRYYVSMDIAEIDKLLTILEQSLDEVP